MFGNEKLQAHVGYDQHRAQQIEKLYQLAKDRGETLSQLAIQWLWQQRGSPPCWWACTPRRNCWRIWLRWNSLPLARRT